MKKKLVLASALSATIAFGAIAAYAADPNPFTDISGSYAKEAILQLQKEGVLTGIDAEHFDPQGTLTRAQFVTIIVKALGLPVDKDAVSSFTDVDAWAVPYVEAAKKAGIIDGMGDGIFAPSSNITREQTAVVMVKALISKGLIEDKDVKPNFTDADSISDWALKYVALAQEYKLISGNPDGSFNPQGDATREQAATMGANLINTVKDITDDKPTTPPTTTPAPTPTVTPAPVSGGGGGGGGGGGSAPSDSTAPTVPTNVTASNITQTSLSLTWTASTDNKGVTGYDVYQGTTKLGTVTAVTYAVTNLVADTEYSFTVKARDAAGNVSAASTAVTARTLAVEVPAPVDTQPIIDAIIHINEVRQNGIVISVAGDGSDVDYEDAWVSQSAWDALEAEVVAATNSMPDLETNEDVAAVVATMNTALETFQSAVNEHGSYVDKVSLDANIRHAKDLKDATHVSVDGSDIPVTEFWVTQADYETFESAINTAVTAYDTVKNKAEVDAAVTEIHTAIASFIEAKKAGTKAEAVAPVISNIHIESNNSTMSNHAKVGDVVTLKFTTIEEVAKLGNFKINGGNPTSFTSEQDGDVWVNTATYTIDESDPEGAMNFQINVVSKASGLYSITTEATTDASAVYVQQAAPVISNVHIQSNNVDPTVANVGDTVTLSFDSSQPVFKLGNFKINGSNPTTFVASETGVVATYVVEESDPLGLMNFQINVKNGAGLFSITTEATTDNSSVTVVEKEVEAPAPVAVSNVHIVSNNPNVVPEDDKMSVAKVGDLITLTFTTGEEVSKLSNFKINGGNPVTFSSVQNGDVWENTATYLIDETDPEGIMTFQINVKNADGIYSQTIEATTDNSSVWVLHAPVITDVHIESNNANPNVARTGDTVTLKVFSNQGLSKLSNFKINGNNPSDFTSQKIDKTHFVFIATYKLDGTDPEGQMTFQINAKNIAGLYTVTTEATTDGSYVSVTKSPLIKWVHIKSSNADPTKAVVGDTVTIEFETAEHMNKLSNFKINGSNPTTFTSVGSLNLWLNTATYVIEESDPVGAVNFQINVKNDEGFYAVTTEATTDGSSVTVEAPVVVEPTTQLTLTAPAGKTVTAGEKYQYAVNLKGNVEADHANDLVRIYATIQGLTAADITFDAIPEAGSPEVVNDGTDGALVLAWGPSSGFPLSMNEVAYESEEGATTTFDVTTTKVGTFPIFFEVKGNNGSLASAMASITVNAPEVTPEP